MVGNAQLFAEGFTLGISTGLACLATCGPIYSAYLMQLNRTAWRYVTAVLEMSLGRFIMYILIGAVAGLLGTQVEDIQRDYFTVISYLLFSMFLLISVFRTKKCDSGCKAPRWNKFADWPVLLGFVTGINVCPSFLLAFSRSFSLSGPIAGMMFFAAFFIGTSLFLIPISFIGMFGKKELFRNIARIAAVLVSIWFITSAVRTGYTLVKPIFDKRPVINLLDNAPMYIVLQNRAKAELCAVKLAQNRPGKVIISDSLPLHKGTHYIFTDSLTVGADTSKVRRADCFTVIVKNALLESPDSLERAIHFLKEYHFRFNYVKGDVFYVR
jgi:sulfite exporter TauE/SafE